MRSIRGADGLRALACLMVVFHHLFQRLDTSAMDPGVQFVASLFLTGFSGVSVFFVLSGFLLAHPFWEAYLDGGDQPDLRVYALRRSARIMPGFYLNLFVCFFLSLAFVPGAPALILRYFAGLSFTAGAHWLTLFPTELNGPLWSIGFEVFSYLLMPLGMVGLFVFFGKKRSFGRAFGWWIVLFALVLGGNQIIQTLCQPDSLGRGWEYGLVGGAKEWSPSYNLIGFFGHFCFGILGAGLSVFWHRNPRAQALASRGLFDALAGLLAAGWVAILLLAVGKGEFFLSIQHQPDFFPLFPLVNGLLLASLSQSRFLGQVFDNPWARYTSRISFGLYLWHMVVMEILRLAWRPDFENDRMVDFGAWALVSLAVVVVAFAVASLSWFYFEKPILDRAHRWKPSVGRRAPNPKLLGALALAATLLVLVPGFTAWAVPEARQSADRFFVKPLADNPVVAAGVGTLTVEVSRARNDHGKIHVYVYSPGDFTPETIVRDIEITPRPGETQVVTIADLPYGIYAVDGFHDEDGDGTMLMSASHIPQEGYISATGLSPRAAPVYDEVKFVFDHDQRLIRPIFYF